MGCSSLSPCRRPMDQQGALCHPSLPQTLDSLHLLKLAFDCCQSNVLFCSTCLLYDQTDTRINIGAHGSRRNISRLMIFRGSRCWWEYFFIWEPSVSDPYLDNYIRNQPGRSCPAPSAVHINVKLHQSATHPHSQCPFSTPPSLYQLSLNVISSCTRLH